MPKLLKDILDGVKKSKIVPGSTGSDPGVDYAPKAPNEQEFVKKHEREEHADRVGNGDDIYQATNIKSSLAKETQHGRKNIEDSKSVNEAKLSPEDFMKGARRAGTGSDEDLKSSMNRKRSGPGSRTIKKLDRKELKRREIKEAAKCNMTEEGTYCPVHEMADCSSPKKTLKEVLTQNTSAKEIIDDFENSNDPKFAGKSKEERRRMALGAYYSMHPEKSKKKVDEDLAVPLLGGSDGDESAEMAKTQLRALANKALHLAMQLGDEQMIEPWVQAKIAVAKDNVTAVHDYMVYGEHSKNKENEQTAPYEGGIDMSGALRNPYSDFSVDVGRNV